MTTPNSSTADVDAFGEQAQQAHDALTEMGRMMVGTSQLVTQPGVLWSLHQASAHPADAQAIDQFMQSLAAQVQVGVARAAGSKINLSNDQQAMLKQNGVNFSDVLYTKQDAAQETVNYISKQSNGAETAKLNDDGSLALDKNGNVQVEKVNQGGGGGSGWFDSVDSFFGHLGHAIKDVAYDDTVKPIVHGMTKGYNFATTETGKLLDQVAHAGQNLSSTASAQASGNAAAGVPEDTDAEDMKSQGYDPTSLFSRLAFAASGKAHTNLSHLNEQYGEDKVTEALNYLNDPAKYQKQLLSDPSSFTTGADGEDVLTPDAKAKLTYLNSQEFQHLALRLNAAHATFGNEVANALGVDPIHHSTTYNLTSAGVNLAASFVVDPTMMAFGALKAVKVAQIGLDTLGDSTKAAQILTSTGSKLPYVQQVQRGWQRGIDLADQIREANSAGDTVKAAQVTAQFNAELPTLAPIMDQFVGGDRVFQGYSKTAIETNAMGKAAPAAVFGQSDGIRSLDDAADFVSSKWGMTRLMNGRAATQEATMPGALSAFGYKRLKGVTASWMTGRSARRADEAYTDVLSRADADPALAKKLIDDGMLVRMVAHADDAVLPDGTVLAQVAERDPSMLPSQSRGLALTAAGKGDVTLNLRRTGDALGQSGGRFSPAAVAARTRLAATRFTTLLPRNTVLDINDPRSGETVYRAAMTYLGRGDANTLRSAWEAGDGGTKKAIANGLIDQLGHAAGLSRSQTGLDLMNSLRSAEQRYSAAGPDGEVLLNGQPIGLFEGQTRTTFTLPSFRELQKDSAKIGLWESTFGRLMTRSKVDTLGNAWKTATLFKPSTTTRNQLEGWLRTALDGKAGDAVKARVMLTTPNKELWDRGLDLTSSARSDWQAAVDAGDTKLATTIERSSRLTGQHLGRSTLGTRVAQVGPLALAGRAYRALVGTHMDDETVEALLSLGPDELGEALAGYREQVLAADLGFAHAARQATDIAKDGYGPAQIRYAVAKATSDTDVPGEMHALGRWSDQPVDGQLGLDRYAHALSTRVDKMPATAKAGLDYLTATDRSTVSLDDVVTALEQESKNTAFGKVTWDDPIGAPNAARRAVTPDEVASGKREWAQRVVDEYAGLLTGRNGKFQDDLADYIRAEGKAPDSAWIADTITADNRPGAVLAPEIMAMPNGGIKNLPTQLQDLTGAAYQWMVERPLQRTTTSPVFLANYAIARKGLNSMVEEMAGQGIEKAAAENLAKELAVKQAWVKSESMIDDPGQLTQFDVVARNFFPFSRATQAMIRRWGAGLWQNPAAARKMMLAYEGAQHSGMIYKDSYGDDVFTYPGSGAMGQVMKALNGIPGLGGIAQFPVAADMTGTVVMSVPGADNPFRMGAGPMLAYPVRLAYKNLFPTAWQGDAEKFDAWFNGPIGAGDSSIESLIPNPIRKFIQNWSPDQRNSAVASATNGAIANLAAAGYVPSPDASPSEMQAFRSRVFTQVQNQMWLRYALGLFAPSAPHSPTEDVPGTQADFAFQLDGVRGLSDEYKAILNEVGGDVGRATAVFTALHPDQLAFKQLTPGGHGQTKLYSAEMQTKTQAVTKGVYLPSTDAALNWLTNNGEFVKKYRSVSAYFVPASAGDGEFSDAAYNAELELGLRQKKTPQEFMDAIYVRNAENSYYPAKARFDDAITQAKDAGNKQLASQLTQAKSVWQKEFRALNPLLDQKLSSYGDAYTGAENALSDLRQMLHDKAVPDGKQTAVAALIGQWDGLQKFLASHAGNTDQATATRTAGWNAFDQWAHDTLPQEGLASLYNGVFGTISSHVTDIEENQ